MAFVFTSVPAGAAGWRRFRRGRRDEGTERRDDRLDVRPRAGFLGVEAAPHRRDMGGRVAAAAADDARAAIRREPAYLSMSSGVPE